MRRRMPGSCVGQPGITVKILGAEAWGTRTSMERREESGRVGLTDALMDRGRLGSERFWQRMFLAVRRRFLRRTGQCWQWDGNAPGLPGACKYPASSSSAACWQLAMGLRGLFLPTVVAIAPCCLLELSLIREVDTVGGNGCSCLRG